MTSSRRLCQLPAWDLHINLTVSVPVRVSALFFLQCFDTLIVRVGWQEGHLANIKSHSTNADLLGTSDSSSE